MAPSAPGSKSSNRVDALAAALLAARGGYAFDQLWGDDPKAAMEAAEKLAAAAARAGELEALLRLAEKLGGVDVLLARFPELIALLAAGGHFEALEALVGLAPFAWSRRKKKSEPIPRWELLLAAAAVSANSVSALDDAIAQGALSRQFFEAARFGRGRTLMFEARHAEMVELLASQGSDLRARDDAGASALSAALARAAKAPEDSAERAVALRLAQLGGYDDALSADLLAGTMGMPEILKAGLGAGARADAPMHGGLVALRSAVDAGDVERAALLASAGADPHVAGRDGISAHEAALASGDAKMAAVVSGPKAAADKLAMEAKAQERKASAARGPRPPL